MSKLQETKECYVCKTKLNLELHHCIFGKNRKKCDEDKLTVWLCQEHHRGNNGVHFNKDLDLRLKRISEKIWLNEGHTIEEFINRYGRNYL